MKGLYLVCLFLFLFSFACKRDPIPAGAIDRNTFVNVLTDVHLAEGMYAERYRIKLDSLSAKSNYLSALKKHGVTEEEMVITTLYYSRHPREYDKIFSEVLSKISILIEENNATVSKIEK